MAEKKNLRRLNCQISEEAYEFLKDYSVRRGLSLGGAVSVASLEFKKQEDCINSLSYFSNVFSSNPELLEKK